MQLYYNLLNVSFKFLFCAKIMIGINGKIKILNGKIDDDTEPIITS